MRNAEIIHYALFWNKNNGLQCPYIVNNGLQSASTNRGFLNIIHKMVQILQQWFIGPFMEQTRRDVETREVSSIADSLSLNFLVYFAEMSCYFSMKRNKRKVRKSINCMKEFSRRFDLAYRKYLSIFLRVFARIVKVTHFAQIINFRERSHGKIHPRKVDKNNREST